MRPIANTRTADLDQALTRMLQARAESAPMPGRLFDVPRISVVGLRWVRPMRAVAVAATIAAGVLVVAAAIRLSAPGTSVGGPLAGVEVSILTDQVLRMTPEQAAVIAIEELEQAEVSYGRALAPIRILSVTAIPEERISEVLREDGHPLSGDIVWVVKAQGTFVAPRIVGGELERRRSTEGHYVIWDRDGSLQGWGFGNNDPLPR
jgi:hypothetical protein